MKFTPRQYAVSFYEAILKSSKEEQKKVIKNFIKILVKNNDLGRSEKIMESLSEFTREKKNIVMAEVKTAWPLEVKERKKVLAALSEMTKKNIELKEEVDEKIIGGLTVKIKDFLIDGSIYGKLSLLKEKLRE